MARRILFKRLGIDPEPVVAAMRAGKMTVDEVNKTLEAAWETASQMSSETVHKSVTHHP
jgi:hypothetical protein